MTAGLSKGADAEKFYNWRAAELKHGRVAMAAVTGYLVQEGVRFPGYLSPSAGLKFSDVPNGVAALGSVPFLGWVQLIAFVGFLETILKQEEGAEPGLLLLLLMLFLLSFFIGMLICRNIRNWILH